MRRQAQSVMRPTGFHPTLWSWLLLFTRYSSVLNTVISNLMFSLTFNWGSLHTCMIPVSGITQLPRSRLTSIFFVKKFDVFIREGGPAWLPRSCLTPISFVKIFDVFIRQGRPTPLLRSWFLQPRSR